MDSGVHQNKKTNPRERANPLSVVTFFYTLPLFFKGWKKDLEVGDLYDAWSVHKSSKLGDRIEEKWILEEENAKKQQRQPSLKKVIFKTFGVEFLLCGIPLAFSELFVKILQPIALGELILYFSPGVEKTISERDSYLYAAGVIGCSLIVVLISHPYIMCILHVGMKVRIACCSLIYRKALKLSKTATGQTTVGQVVNLLANDVSRFDIAAVFVHWIWLGPAQTIIITYFMYQEIGIAAVIGVVVLTLFIPLQFFLGSLTSKLRLKTAIRTDERVRLMNEVITGIQVIKMYTWEKPFAKLVSLARRTEISSIRGVSYVRGVFSSFILFTTRLTLFISILSYVLFEDAITARQVFAVTAYYNTLRNSMTNFFPQAIALIAETNVSVQRINNFLLNKEQEMITDGKEMNGKVNGISEKNDTSKGDDDAAVTITEGTAKWSDASSENTFTNVNLSIKPGSLVAVIGPVGSGKTSLFHAILKELPLIMGRLNVKGRVSYASQEPWLFTGSIRQNILFGNEMDKYRYKNVISKCVLERDFSLFPYGDKTLVGERGISLSGGQRARINLARAVYKDADVYLLDDPLSAVDTHVGKQLYEECIQDFLFNKTVILITHQLQYLKDADHIIILEDGIIKAEGNFSELQESGLDFAKLLNSNSEENEKEQKNTEDEKKRLLQQQASTVSSISVEESAAPVEVQEQQSTGAVAGAVYGWYIKASANCCSIFFFGLLLIFAQFCVSGADYFLSFWVNLEQERAENGTNKSFFSSVALRQTMINDDEFLGLQRSQDDFWDFSRETCIYIYSGLTAGIVIFAIIRSMTFFSLCMRASKKLHDFMFDSVIRASMRFFNTNSSGRILNRFSKDIGAIDERLPLTMLDVLQIGLMLVGIVLVIATVEPWLLLPSVVIIIIFYFLRIFYLRTSRDVKRLEGVTRSPVFGHLNASLQGLTTIRAFGAQTILEREFDKHQDLHSSAFYCFIGTSTAFGYILDLICTIYIAVVTLSFLVIGDEQYGGNVGLAITQSLGLTGMFQWGMRQTTELENLMTSVERVMEYTEIEHEPALESAPDKKPPASWPDKGEIKFEKLYLHYFLDDPPVLRNLNFTINPLEKVGIVGRTGAGKSSLISALFLLTDTKGSIVIDGVVTKEIGLHDLRSKISIIPQEPVLFSGTMRKNLDPFDEYNDEVLWKALEEVELREVVADLSEGLNSKMSEGGSNFSVGQRQLVCLARAIIRNNKILVLDEATANVDPQTDALIQHTIRRKFADCTVLTIAHRLHTIMDSDKVLVMDAGTMVEFDHPHVLLQNKDGHFYSMVQQTGKAMADVLMKIAKKKYDEREPSESTESSK